MTEIESLRNEKEDLQKQLEKEKKEFLDEIDSLNKKRIWGIEIATGVFLSSAVVMSFLAWVVVTKTINTEQAAVLIAIVVGWFALVVAFCQIYGRNDDTWR
ncbi:MAG: hypothetical protein JJE30_11100 [Desulfuromonadales bacterium]|nr:hypothetical protein [Desulfuromonadales bacterium]